MAQHKRCRNQFPKKYGIPDGVEIHAFEVVSGKSQETKKIGGKKQKVKTLNWFGLNYRNKQDRFDLLVDLLTSIMNLKSIHVFSVIIDKAKIRLPLHPLSRVGNPKLQSLEFLSERFNFFIKTQSNVNGMMIVDSVGLQDDALHHAHQRKLFSTSRHLSSGNFIETLLFARSDHSNLLQVADVCSWAVYRKYTQNDPHLFNVIQPYFWSVGGVATGRGHKVWP